MFACKQRVIVHCKHKLLILSKLDFMLKESCVKKMLSFRFIPSYLCLTRYGLLFMYLQAQLGAAGRGD
jgi:hypothetical protein